MQDDPARAARITGRLAEVERARRGLDAALAILASDLDPNEARQAERIAAGKRKGLDGAIGMALFDPARVPDGDLARAAGVDQGHVDAVRARLIA